MIGTKIRQSTRTLLYSVSCLCIAALALWMGADFSKSEAQSKTDVSPKTISTTGTSSVVGGGIPGTGAGPIPDGPPTQCGTAGLPLEIMFDASGVSGTITDVTVDMTATHSWVGDVGAFLVAPDGTEHIVFSRTSGTTSPTTCGSSDNLIGVVYAFNNSGTSNWWDLPISYPAGTYQTTLPGGVATPGGAPTDMNAAFAGVNPTGTWKLRFTDSGGGDTGSVAAANLTLVTGSVATGPTHNDFDGDGTTDYSVIRDDSGTLASSNTRYPGSVREKMRMIADRQPENVTGTPAPGTTQTWYVNNSMSGTDTVLAFGESIFDFTTPADFDGDGRADIAIWRGTAPSGPGGGYFFIVNSSDSTVSTVDFGIQGDNPTVAGDYDGDGKADPAVFRCPASPGQCNYFYKGSAGAGDITSVPWGFGTPSTIFPSAGDYDGDGKFDFNIQRAKPGSPGKGQFVLRRSIDGGVEFIDFGNDTDFIVPGDYDGDGKNDIAVGRSESGLRVWYVLFRAGGTAQAQFGLATDFIAPGDYDGDGKTDLGVFRPDPGDPNNNIHYVYRSSTGTVSGFEYGQNFDYPLANWQVN